jgi:hypothetical protein
MSETPEAYLPTVTNQVTLGDFTFSEQPSPL